MMQPSDSPVEWIVADLTTGEIRTESGGSVVSPEEFMAADSEISRVGGYHFYCTSCRAGATYPCPLCPQGHCSIAYHRTRLSRPDDRERRR
jgi:hypothetical protein